MRCPNCDRAVRDTASFCESCGTILQRDDPRYQLSYAHRLECAGELEAAIAEYENLLETEQAAEQEALIRKHLGNLHLRLGHLRRAEKHLERACGLSDENPAFWHDLGVIQYYMCDFDGCVTALKEALGQDPDHHLSYFWLGNALYHLGRVDEAVEAFEELLERYPNFTIARFHLGVIHARQGRKKEAVEEFRRLLLQNPEDAAARFYVS
jgi:tetratricopeptide (TPR) repeat protein